MTECVTPSTSYGLVDVSGGFSGHIDSSSGDSSSLSQHHNNAQGKPQCSTVAADIVASAADKTDETIPKGHSENGSCITAEDCNRGLETIEEIQASSCSNSSIPDRETVGRSLFSQQSRNTSVLAEQTQKSADIAKPCEVLQTNLTSDISTSNTDPKRTKGSKNGRFSVQLAPVIVPQNCTVKQRAMSLEAALQLTDITENVESTIDDRKRKVSFPEGSALIKGCAHAPNPWYNVSFCTTENLVSAYLDSCDRHGVRPLSKLVAQLKCITEFGERINLLMLKGEHLSIKHVETLEEIFRRVQFNSIDMDNTYLDDEAAIAVFDMIEYYESTHHIKIAHNKNLTMRAWFSCSRMIRKTASLESLDMRGCAMNEQCLATIGRALRMGAFITILHMEECNLACKGVMILAAALRTSPTIKELFLGENNLQPSDGIQLGNLIKNNLYLHTLDLRNNHLQDVGVAHISDGLSRQPNSGGLHSLNLSNNHITFHGMSPLGTALSITRSLQALNVSHNNLTNEGIYILKEGLLKNKSLAKLSLLATKLSCEGAVAVAEYIADSFTITQLDMRENDIKTAGLIALSMCVRVHQTVTRLELDQQIKKENAVKDYQAQQRFFLDEIQSQLHRNAEMKREQVQQLLEQQSSLLHQSPHRSPISAAAPMQNSETENVSSPTSSAQEYFDPLGAVIASETDPSKDEEVTAISECQNLNQVKHEMSEYNLDNSSALAEAENVYSLTEQDTMQTETTAVAALPDVAETETLLNEEANSSEATGADILSGETDTTELICDIGTSEPSVSSLTTDSQTKCETASLPDEVENKLSNSRDVSLVAGDVSDSDAVVDEHSQDFSATKDSFNFDKKTTADGLESLKRSTDLMKRQISEEGFTEPLVPDVSILSPEIIYAGSTPVADASFVFPNSAEADSDILTVEISTDDLAGSMNEVNDKEKVIGRLGDESMLLDTKETDSSQERLTPCESNLGQTHGSTSEHIVCLSETSGEVADGRDLSHEHSTRTTSDSEHSAWTTSDGEHSLRTTSDGEHSARTTSDVDHSTKTTSDVDYSARTTSDVDHSAWTTSDGEHSLRTTSDGEHSARTTSDADHSTKTTSDVDYSARTTSDVDHSARTTSDGEPVTLQMAMLTKETGEMQTQCNVNGFLHNETP